MELPTLTNASAIPAITNGMMTNVRNTLFFSKRSIRSVPTSPARPSTNNMSDNRETLTWVTASRNGRR